MTGLQVVPLGDILSIARNGLNVPQYNEPVDDGQLAISRIETISNGEVNLERVKYATVTPAQRAKHLLKAGDILFSHINSVQHIGKTAIVEPGTLLIHGVNLLLLRPNQKFCHPHYLNYYLKSQDVRASFRARCKRAVNQASLNQEDIRTLKVPLPSLSEQKRIAAILNTADHLRRLRRYALELSDGFLQSVFLEMFGDPVTNPMGWEIKLLQELITADRPVTYGILKPGPNLTDGVPYIRVVDMFDGGIKTAQVRRTSQKIAHEYRRSKLRQGDLLLSNKRSCGKIIASTKDTGGC